MCGRFTQLFSWSELEKLMRLVCPAMELLPRYNIAPTQSVPLVRYGGPKKGEVTSMRWGLIPSFGLKGKNSTGFINARLESILEKPSFKSAATKRRCIIPASGYFEWKKEGKGKTPFYITPKNRDLLLFAGVFEQSTSVGESNRKK